MIEYSDDEPSGPMMDCEDEDRFRRFLERKRREDRTLNEALKAAGFESVSNGRRDGTKDIRRISDGEFVARSLLASSAWEWLRKQEGIDL